MRILVLGGTSFVGRAIVRRPPVRHTEEPRLVVQLLADDRPGADAHVDIVQVPRDTVPSLFPLIRPDWSSRQRSPARARGFSPEQEQAVLSPHDNGLSG